MKTKLKINSIIGIAALCTICNAQELTYTGNIIQVRQFAQNQNITRIICPNVVQIEGNAFNGSAIEEILLNENQPVELSPRAFANAQHLKLVNLGKTKNIPDYCFDGCANLRIFRADYVTHIGAYAFNNCRDLNLIFPEGLVETDPNAFTNSKIRMGRMHVININKPLRPIFNHNNRGQQQISRNEAYKNDSDSFESFIEGSFEEDSK